MAMAAAKLAFRPGTPTDVAALVELYDRHYRGGYSACFDRYGPATPQDFWWVQSEKSVTLVEVNRKPVGVLIVGRSERRLLTEEVLLEALWRQSDVRVMVAEWEAFPVALLIAQVKDGAGRWTVGVREAHRGKGIGRALAHAALQFFQGKSVPAVTTYWGTDPSTARFVHALGARTERTYLYFERPL